MREVLVGSAASAYCGPQREHIRTCRTTRSKHQKTTRRTQSTYEILLRVKVLYLRALQVASHYECLFNRLEAEDVRRHSSHERACGSICRSRKRAAKLHNALPAGLRLHRFADDCLRAGRTSKRRASNFVPACSGWTSKRLKLTHVGIANGTVSDETGRCAEHHASDETSCGCSRSGRSCATSRMPIQHQQSSLDGFPQNTGDSTGNQCPAFDTVGANSDGSGPSQPGQVQDSGRSWPLEGEEYKRYGRQLIMPEIGLQGQLRLKHSSVLIIGVGGLGCPAAAYLAGAGIGRIGLVDGDTVETSNLHRQILHGTSTVGMSKVASAIRRLHDMNPMVNYIAHEEALLPQTALHICSQYDLILDCTDHPTSRYLISDACVLAQKPLVSASALRVDGQLTVLNSPPAPAGDARGGPCYRCIWPKPPPAESITSCGEGGIIGPVVGVMGVLMALESIKLLTSGKLTNSPGAGYRAAEAAETSRAPASMLLFSGYGPRQFQSIKLPGRRNGCPACSNAATVSAEALNSGSLDYIQFCGVNHPIDVLQPDQRISAMELASFAAGTQARSSSTKYSMVVDVREKVQFDICHLPGSLNVPFSELMSWRSGLDVGTSLRDFLRGFNEEERAALTDETKGKTGTPPTVLCICRLGNDSQLAVQKLIDLQLVSDRAVIKDIRGGLRAWRLDVEEDWPDY